MYTPKSIFATKHHARELGFLIPEPDQEVNFTQASFENRKGTVLKWATETVYHDGARRDFPKPDAEDEVKWGLLNTLSFENKPVSGFKLITLNGRYSTETEYLVVQHPNGYQFEVPFGNVLEVLHHAGCKKGGELGGKLYLQYGTKWSLVCAGTEMEKAAIQNDQEARAFHAERKKQKSSKLAAGDVVRIDGLAGLFVYVGKHKAKLDGEVHLANVKFGYQSNPSGGNRLNTMTVEQTFTAKFESLGDKENYMIFIRHADSSCEGHSNFYSKNTMNGKYDHVSENPKKLKEAVLFKSKSVKIHLIGLKDEKTLANFSYDDSYQPIYHYNTGVDLGDWLALHKRYNVRNYNSFYNVLTENVSEKIKAGEVISRDSGAKETLESEYSWAPSLPKSIKVSFYK